MQTTTTSTSSPSKISYQPTVLVVDDNSEDLFYLSTAIKIFNYHCLTTSDPMTALSLAQKEQPDLILLDIRLPQINGIELLNILRIDWLTRSIPVIAITGLTGVKERKQIASAGFNRCLYKPYLLEDLESIVSSQIIQESLL